MADTTNKGMAPLDEQWSGKYDHDQVEARIKWMHGSKFGYVPDHYVTIDGANYWVGFATEEDYLTWEGDPEGNAGLLLGKMLLPTGGGSTETEGYSAVKLYTGTASSLVTTDAVVKLKLRFVSFEYDSLIGTNVDTNETGTLIVERRATSTGSWTEAARLENFPSLPYASSDYQEADITKYLSQGYQQVRVRVVGSLSGQATGYKSFEITKATIGLSFATDWSQPVTDGVMRLSYYVSGAVAKTVNAVIDGKRTVTRDVGSSVYTETPLQINVTDSSADAQKVVTHGLHTIEAWVSVNGSAVESEHVFSQVLVITDNTDTASYLILNDVKQSLTNWTSETLFNYAVYNNSDTPVPLTFSLTNAAGTEEYMTLAMGNVACGTKHALTNMLEIDSEESQISAVMSFISGSSALHDPVSFAISNEASFAPVSEPDFILNPKARTNSEEDPATIVNAADGSEVEAEFDGLGFSSDGWTADDEGNKCLRVLAGQSVEIAYESFSGYINTNNRSSLTVELDFATRNCTDTDESVLRMCTYLGAYPLGLEVKPQEACFMTTAKQVRRDQDVMFQEGARTHLALNIVYGINGTSLNLARIFINGVINREFEWETADSFVQVVDGSRTSKGIRIGSQSCDIDVYGIRVYKRAISASDVQQDYVASLATSEEKAAFREANDILDDNNLISYSKTRELYNTIVVTGTVPDYTTGNITTATDVEIHIQGDPEHSGKLNNMATTGQGTSSRSYWKWNFQWKFNSDSKFVNENGKDMGSTYALDSTVPEAAKLVAKLNWASSQQSHKMGSCNLFTDLYKAVLGGTSITQTSGFEKARMSVKQKPFFLFVRADEESDPVFYGLYTFGPGKGDKPTFGCDKTAFPNYLMLEGCDNGEPLVNHRIPWNDDIALNDAGEIYMYNGSKQWEITLGSASSVGYFISAFNLCYLCNPHVNPWEGDLASLQASASADTTQMYWVTAASEGSAVYDLYRYDALTAQWVDAGIAKLGSGSYEKLNLAAQLGLSPTGTDYAAINQSFIDARVAKFAAEAGACFNLDDAFYHQMFVKLIAASDNRAKNTYLYLAPADGVQKIHFAQDDLDTIMLTDNVGRKSKPYYVEEHDLDEEGGTYWNGEQNALYDLLELAFPDEERAMMKRMLEAMSNISSDKSLMGCMEDYYFSTQRYFPAVAYNEAARLNYEAASAAWGTKYTASTHPITQSLGDQLQGELQWMRLRLVYISSFASYGTFQMNGDGALTFRSQTTLAGSAPAYAFSLTPHMWIYPAVSAGSSTLFGKGKSRPQRVEAGQTYVLDGVSADNDTNIQIHGIHYYRKIGEFGDKSIGSSFTVAGDRLTEFSASKVGSGLSALEFRPSAISDVTAPNLKSFDINGASTVKGAISFGAQPRLSEIDLRGTGVTSVSVLEPRVVTKLGLPASLTSLELADYVKLAPGGLLSEGLYNLQSYSFSNCPLLDSKALINEVCAANQGSLGTVKVLGVDWVGFSLDYLLMLAEINADLRGKIVLDPSDNVTFDLKWKMLSAWGNVDSADNSLYVTYTSVGLTSVAITGPAYISAKGKCQLGIKPSSDNANDMVAVEWSITENQYASIDSATGLLTVTAIGTEAAAPKATVTVKFTLADGTVLTDSRAIGFYERSAKVGDYVFADGSYSDVYGGDKTIVGKCFYIDPDYPSRRLMCAKELVSDAKYLWGLAADLTLGDNPGYSTANIAALEDKTLGISGATVGLTENGILDANATDGYVQWDESVALGEIGWHQINAAVGEYAAGASIPWGLENTLKIIEHRNLILNDSNVSLEVPAETAHETEMERLLACFTEHSSQILYYYPPASLCHAYEPVVADGEVLSPKFKSGMWFLPSAGELVRLFAEMMLKGTIQDAELKALLTSHIENNWLFTSSEQDATHSYRVSFGAASVLAGGGGVGKANFYPCQAFAICAF